MPTPARSRKPKPAPTEVPAAKDQSEVTPANIAAADGSAASRSDPEHTLAFAVGAARLMHDDKCEDIAVLDVRGVSQVSDYIIVASGTSERQMRSVLDDVQAFGAERGFRAFRATVDQRATWVLADFVDVVVHVFEPGTRAHYDLEMLWGDAPRVDWQRPEPQTRDRAGLHTPSKIVRRARTADERTSAQD